MKLINPPENDSFRKDLCFSPDVLFFIFLHSRNLWDARPTGAKFCTMVSNRPYFIMPVQNFGGTPQKNFRGQKHAKFSLILDDFKVRRRISPKQMNIFKIGFLFRLPRFLLRYAKQVQWSLVQWPWRSWCNRTHPKCIFRKTIFRSLGGAALPNVYTC